MEIIPTQKIVNRDGIKAVKNGQKANQYSSIPNQKKPDWIRVKATFDANFKGNCSKQLKCFSLSGGVTRTVSFLY
mgnify:CR=1 FL=1